MNPFIVVLLSCFVSGAGADPPDSRASGPSLTPQTQEKPSNADGSKTGTAQTQDGSGKPGGLKLRPAFAAPEMETQQTLVNRAILYDQHVAPVAADGTRLSYQNEIRVGRQTAAAYDGVYGPDSYKKMDDLSTHCSERDRCDIDAVGRVFVGARAYLDLQSDPKIRPSTAEYDSKFAEIKGKIQGGLDKLEPRPDARRRYRERVTGAAQPVAIKIFKPTELQPWLKPTEQTKPEPVNPNEQSPRPPNMPSYTVVGERAFQNASRTAQGLLTRGVPVDAPSGGAPAQSALGAAGDGALRGMGPFQLEDAGFSAGPAAFAGGAAGASVAAAPAFQEGAAPAAPPASPRFGFTVPQFAANASLTEARRSLKIGDTRAAIRSLLQATAADPKNVRAQALLSVTQSRRKDFRSAVAAANAGLLVEPANQTLLNAKAYALAGMRDYRGALAVADRALDIDAKDAVAHFNRAVALGGLGDREGMLRELRAASDFAPRFVPYLRAAEADLGANMEFLFEEHEMTAQDAAPSAAPGIPLKWWLPLLLAGSAVLGTFFFLLLRMRAAARRPAGPGRP